MKIRVDVTNKGHIGRICLQICKATTYDLVVFLFPEFNENYKMSS